MLPSTVPIEGAVIRRLVFADAAEAVDTRLIPDITDGISVMDAMYLR